MKVAALGDNCVDYYRNLGRWYVTGNVVDFGVHMQLQGIATSVITVTGNDAYGLQLIQELKRVGIDVSHIRVEKGKTALVELDLVNGERVYRSFSEGVMETAHFSEPDILFAQKHDLVHLGFWGHADDCIPSLAKSGAKISYDFATEGEASKVGALLPYIDYAFFSFEKMDKNAEEFLKEAVRQGAGYAVGTFGERGSLVWDGKRFYHGEIIPTAVENTVGAGDSFIAGFLYGILKSESIEDSLKRGAALASAVIAKFNPW